jgi:mercuric ion binding protein
MKTLKLFLLAFVFIAIAQVSNAQTKTDKINVAGECGSCKKKIEKAAKNAGATYALWNEDSKILVVKYNTSSSKTKIEQAIANVGYDTEDIKANDEAYKKLDKCCQYDRSTSKSDSEKKTD